MKSIISPTLSKSNHQHKEGFVMTHLILGDDMSWRFGTSLALTEADAAPCRAIEQTSDYLAGLRVKSSVRLLRPMLEATAGTR